MRNATQGTAPADGAAVDPRVLRSRAAVIRAATDLLVDGGPSAVTIDAIVARSGVAKTTIYRHWASRDDVLLDVLEACAPSIEDPDPDVDVLTGLHQVGRSLAAALTDPEWTRIFPALLLLRHHEDGVADIEERMERKQENVLGSLLSRGVAEGVFVADANEPEAHAQLLGPIMFAQLTGKVPIDDGFIDRTIDRFIESYRAPARTKTSARRKR